MFLSCSARDGRAGEKDEDSTDDCTRQYMGKMDERNPSSLFLPRLVLYTVHQIVTNRLS